MSLDLTDAEIEEAIGDGTSTHLPSVRMALEIRRLRASRVAAKERVRSVVRTWMLALMAVDGPVTTEDQVDFIADRAAEQLAATE